MKRTWFILTLLSIPFLSWSQQSEFKAGMFLAPSITFADFTALNNEFALASYPEFLSPATGFSIGIAIGNPFALFYTAESHSYTQMQDIPLQFSANMTNSEVYIGIQKNVLKSSKISLFPYLGTGLGVMIITLTDFSGTGQSFANAITTLQGQRELMSPSVLINMGAGVLFAVPIGKFDKLKLGVRGGYKLTLGETLWTVDQYLLSTSPQTNPGGVHLEFVVAFF